MKKIIYSASLLLSVFLAGSCTKENIITSNTPLSGEGTVNLSLIVPIGTRGLGDSDSDASESNMNTLRVIIFKNNAGMELGDPIVNHKIPVNPAADEVEIKELVQVGSLNMYLIGNETAAMTPTLDGLTNSSTLSPIALNYTAAKTAGFLNSPFVMYSAYKGIKIETNGNITHPQAIVAAGQKTKFLIERTAAKLTVKVSCTYAELPVNKEIVLDSAMVINMPLKPWLVSREYSTIDANDFFNTSKLYLNGWYDYTTLGFTPKDRNGDGTEDGFVFYIPEHILNNVNHSNYTYLRLVGHMNGLTGNQLVYRVPLGNGLGKTIGTTLYDAAYLLENFASVSAADLTVTRNMHYILDLKIKGFGDNSPIEVSADVKPWDEVWVDGTQSMPRLNVSTVSTTVIGPMARRIYFWTNQTDSIYLETTGKMLTSAGTDFTVNNTFSNIAKNGGVVWPANFHFNPATGEGYFDVMINPTASFPTKTRHLVYLRASKLRREIEIFTQYIAPQPWATIPWIGTFHRNAEKGERIIFGGNTGAWNAEVENPTGAGAFVVLGDRFTIQDESIYSATPGNPEEFPVMGNLKTLSGTGDIAFRVGMTETRPLGMAPRYARVKITRGSNTSYLYVRQGEGADYLMRPGDKDGSNGSVGGVDNRSYARKFSPYNLTVPLGRTWNADVGYQGADFTKYPTQAGALFQWANIGTCTRYAWDAFSALAPLNWEIGASPVSGFWTGITPFNETHETCPPGYIRPNDGTTLTANPAGDVAGSTMRQSLWLNPAADWALPSNPNFAWGYYADGFFDRHQIVTAPGLLGGSASAVSITDERIAYAGGVFYNPNNNASIFFPAAGHRQGTLNYAGVYGNYISSSVKIYYPGWPTNGRIWTLSVNNLGHAPNLDALIDYGYSIRCVVSTISASVQSIWLSPSPGNDAKSIQITSNDPWVVQSAPTNATALSVSNGGAGTTPITITRSASVFGLQPLVIKNTVTGELINILIDNYQIVNEELVISNNAGLNTGEYELFVYGSSEKYTIVSGSWSSWIESATILPNGKLQLTAYPSSDGEPRTGSITLAHADDPTYTETFTVIQDFNIIPPFQFLVLKFTWNTSGGSDVDIAVEFTDTYDPNNPSTPNPNYATISNTTTPSPSTNPIPFVNEFYADGGSYHRAVGYGLRQAVKLDGTVGTNAQSSVTDASTLMIWGGDATSGQGETVFFKAPLITPADPRNDGQNLPRYITMDAYAIWWSGTANSPIKLSIYTYEGGTMVKTGTSSNGNNLNAPLGYTGQLIYYTNFYNVPLGTNPLDLLNGEDSYALLNPPSSLIAKDLILPRQAMNRVAYFRDPSTGFTRLATITYDRYKRSATVTWHAAEYTGPIIVPFGATLLPSKSQQEEADRTAAEKAAAANK